MLRITILLITFVISNQIFADAKSFYFKNNKLQNLTKLFQNSSKTSSTIEEVYQQKIDHNNPADDRRFGQRYFVNTKYARDLHAPVLFYICGESTCNPEDLDGQIEEHAKRWGAAMFALEHRYYGKSQPFTDLSTENLKYLSIDQALKDLYTFQDFIMKKHGYFGEWITIGGSYPGSLSAYYRLKYPEMVSAALASSAPVMAKENFEEYDAHVTLVAGKNCVSKMREVVAIVEEALDNPTELNNIKRKFQAEGVRNNIDFLYLIADIASAAVQYGYKDMFCQSLNRANPLDGYASFARRLYNAWNMTAVSMTFQSAEDTDPNSYLSSFGMRQWLYQSCTEYGYWQGAHHNPELSSRSSLIDLQYHRDACKRVFGLDKPANTETTNDNYYWPLFDPSTKNILFTNGSTDPWSTLSITDNSKNTNIATYVIDGAAHCDDLRGSKNQDSQELKTSRTLFTKMVNSWTNL